MKKNSTLLFLAVMAVCLVTGCSKNTYYQVYQTNPVVSDQIQQDNGLLVYANDGCEVKYNFFANSGNAAFWFTNNTDSVVYISLSESFFILNGNASDYYQAREWTNTSSQTTNISSQSSKKSGTSMSGTSSTSTKTITFHERGMIVIPPHSTKFITEYQINSLFVEMCGVKETPKKNKPAGLSFTAENSPIQFGNYITYTVGVKGIQKHIDNRFYVSEIINVNSKAMFEDYRDQDACGKFQGEKKQRLRYNTPDRFYITYKKK